MTKHRSKYPLPRLTRTRDLIALALEGAEYRGWYIWAKSEIERTAEYLARPGPKGPSGIKHKTPHALADLLALFSPRVSVTRSVRHALHYVTAGDFAHDCTRSVRAAVLHWERTGEIRGPKTGPFARALLGDSSAIVLDTWMAKALGTDAKRFEVRSHWEHSARAIRRVARTLGWTNAETQAAIWAGFVMRERVNVPLISLVSEIDGIPL